MTRFERLNPHRQALQAATPIKRLLVFAEKRDVELVRDTYKEFVPAIPLTKIAFLHAGGGFMLVWLLLSLLLAPFGYTSRRSVIYS